MIRTHQLAVAAFARHDDRILGPQRPLFGVQPQIGLAVVLIGTVTGEAVVREDGQHVAAEIHPLRLGGVSECRDRMNIIATMTIICTFRFDIIIDSLVDRRMPAGRQGCRRDDLYDYQFHDLSEKSVATSRQPCSSRSAARRIGGEKRLLNRASITQ